MGGNCSSVHPMSTSNESSSSVDERIRLHHDPVVVAFPSHNWTLAAAAAAADRSSSSDATPLLLGGDGGGDDFASGGRDNQLDIEEFRAEMQQEHDVLHEVAHCLHFASIAMLGFLVVEVLVKIIAMGKNFIKHKIEIFDAKIILASFAIDLIFLGGVSGEEGPKAAAVLVILLLWRIARVVDGIVVTVKQRQEFRIRLQKRARRTAEKKMESFEEERHAKTKQIEALKDLCTKAGITDADIAACAPRHGGRQVNSTLCALSSVARLSVSMTMLMSSGIYRPRLFDEDGLVLPNVMGQKAKDPQGQRSSQRQQKQPGSNLTRIESLPIIQDSIASTSGGKQSKMAYAKASRKQYGATGSKTYHQPVIEINEDGAGQLAKDGDADCLEQFEPTLADHPPGASTHGGGDHPSGVSTHGGCDHPTGVSTHVGGDHTSGVSTHGGGGGGDSPVNSSGVHIQIDGISDVEGDDLSKDDCPSFTSVDCRKHREQQSHTNDNSASSASSSFRSEVKVIDWKNEIPNTCLDASLPSSIDDGNPTDWTMEEEEEEEEEKKKEEEEEEDVSPADDFDLRPTASVAKSNIV